MSSLNTCPRSIPWRTLLVILVTILGSSTGFYLPGVAPRDFERRENVTIKVNKLTSTKTQLPYDYYSLPYCKPFKMKVFSENLGEKLRGDLIETSPYIIQIRYDEECKFLCRYNQLSEEDINLLKSRIDDGYRVTM